MAFFSTPDAATIRQHSRLNLEQVWKSFSDADSLDEEIDIRIADKANLVQTKLLPLISQADWEAADSDVLERRNSLASKWVELLTLASLYGSSGQLNRAYWEKAREYKEEAKEYEAALLDELDALDGDADSPGSVPTSVSGTAKAVWAC